ncbi:hypothetical protein FHR57_003320 [Xanthomonas arboricola]|nr:hypothetical protein [Xanthomonas arboricola]
MNVLIDPELLAPFRNARHCTEADVAALKESLEQLTRFTTNYDAKVVSTKHLWRILQELYIAPVVDAFNEPAVRTPLQLLRGRLRVVVPDVNRPLLAWGFEQMLSRNDGQDWPSGYASVAAELQAANESVVLFTRYLEGRNVTTHKAAHSILVEKTRWRMHVGAPSLNGIVSVPCVASLRNADVSWTTRFDDALPDTAPSEGAAFQPPFNWHRGYVKPFRVHQSKFAWTDSAGNGWSDPNTPGTSYHWDVHFVVASDSPIGISPANIVRWGAPRKEGIAGGIHHVPRLKRARVV